LVNQTYPRGVQQIPGLERSRRDRGQDAVKRGIRKKKVRILAYAVRKDCQKEKQGITKKTSQAMREPEGRTKGGANFLGCHRNIECPGVSAFRKDRRELEIPGQLLKIKRLLGGNRPQVEVEGRRLAQWGGGESAAARGAP